MQSHLHDLVRQLDMTLPLGRKDRHGVAFVLSLVLGNICKTLFQEFIIRIPSNFEHKLENISRNSKATNKSR